MINLAVSVLFFVLFIVFAILRESTKTVKELGFGVISTDYEQSYTVLTVLGFFAMSISFVYLIGNLILGKTETLSVGGSTVTLYLGWSARLYIDGECVTQSGYSYYLEGKLKDGSSVTVSLNRNHMYAHMAFSNGHPSVEI